MTLFNTEVKLLCTVTGYCIGILEQQSLLWICFGTWEIDKQQQFKNYTEKAFRRDDYAFFVDVALFVIKQ